MYVCIMYSRQIWDHQSSYRIFCLGNGTVPMPVRINQLELEDSTVSN